MSGSGVGISGGTVLDPRSLDELGTDRFVESAGAGLGAGFASSWQDNISSILGRVVTRGDTSGEAANYWASYQDPAGRGPSQDTLDMERERGDRPNTNVLTPEQANQQFKLPGLKFDAPVGSDAAQSIYETHREKMVRDDIERRVNGGLAYSAARLGVGFLAGLLDPLNLASAAVPVIPEGMVATRLATQAGMAGRAAIRGAAGAVEGAVGQALLEPGMVALNRAELNDYTASQVLSNIMFGTAMGGFLHVATGGIRDWRMSPQDVKSITEASIAQMLDDRPVDITSLVNFAQSQRAAEGITTWYRRWQDRVGADAEVAAKRAGTEELTQGRIADRGKALAGSEDRLMALRSEAENLRGEVNAATRSAQLSRASDHLASLDPVTQERISAIQSELGSVIPRARRAALEAEHTSIIEGVRPTRPDASNLEAARSEAQAQGLSTALSRVEGDAAAQEAALSKMRAADEKATAIENQRRVSRDTTVRIEQRVRDSQREIIETAIRDQLTRFSREAGADVSQADLSRMAKELAAAPTKSEYIQTLGLTLNSIVKGGTSTDAGFAGARAKLEGTRSAGLLAQEADGAAERVGQQAIDRRPRPDIVAAEREQRTVMAEKKGDDLAQVQKELDDVRQAYEDEVLAGRIDDGEVKAELAKIDEDAKMAKAEAEAVACVARG